MALIRLYEAAAATTLHGTDTFAYSLGAGWYMARHDCVVYMCQGGSTYKVYRDGTAIRCCSAQGLSYRLGYSIDVDKMITFFTDGTDYYNDPVSLKYDPSLTSPITYTGIITPGGHTYPVIWQGFYYHAGAGVVTKRSMAGTSVASIALGGTITCFPDYCDITADGLLVAIDFDNGTYASVKFYNLHTNALVYESVFDRCSFAWVDRVNRNIWSISAATGRMQVWSFLVAPQNFSAITMGGNRSRYREDALSVTLRGSVNEPVPNWPVKWTLTTAEGHLEEEYTETNDAGVATNTYCGPGADDYVGGSQTITVETAY